MRTQLVLLVAASCVTVTLGLSSGCGGDDSSGGGGSSTGGSSTGGSSTGGTAGTAGSGGSSSGGASGSGGSSTGGASGSGGSNTGGADSGSGGSDAGACTVPPDAGAACNTLANGASFVKITQVASGVPTGTGGTVADGHYFMTKLEGYTGNPLGSLTMKQTLDICGGVGQLVGDEQGPPVYHKSFTFVTNGTSITATTTCSTQSPNVDVKYSSYTATPTSITFYSTTLVFSVTYTKQ